MKRNIYTVSKINSYIANMFAQDFALGSLSVRGEISNCKYHRSGHIYFTLKDEGSSLHGVMFAKSASDGLNFKMKDGDSVVVSGRIAVYEKNGEYQIYAEKIETAASKLNDIMENLYMDPEESLRDVKGVVIDNA